MCLVRMTVYPIAVTETTSDLLPTYFYIKKEAMTCALKLQDTVGHLSVLQELRDAGMANVFFDCMSRSTIKV